VKRRVSSLGVKVKEDEGSEVQTVHVKRDQTNAKFEILDVSSQVKDCLQVKVKLHSSRKDPEIMCPILHSSSYQSACN
jgi:hypothetical protein